MVDVDALLADLAAEHEALDGRVEHLDDETWHTPTPAEGWDVADQISHLAYFDGAARLALSDAAEFEAQRGELLPAGRQMGAATPDVALARGGRGPDLLEVWRRERAGMIEAAGATDPGERVPWYGPAMSLASFVTARIMETWAHGQDIADALGLPPVVSARLRHVCHIGVGARGYSFAVHDRGDPGDPVRVEVEAPDGTMWTWGPHDARDRVRARALDLALLLTQRRHRDDVAVAVEGPTAEAWIAVAQAFAGPAGPGRARAAAADGS